MDYTVKLTPEEEQRILNAQQKGLNIDSLIHGLIAALPPVEVTPPGMTDRELFAQWAQEDALMTPEEIAEVDARTAEFDRNMAETGGRIILDIPDVAEHA